MRKKSLLTKVVALGAMTTLLASTTAFAATAPTVSTKTIYLKGEPNYVYVTTTVSGVSANDEVTYLAGDSTNPIYINQYTIPADTSGTYSFSYKTTKENVVGNSVKVAKADSTFTDTAKAKDGTLPATDKFTLTLKIDDVDKGTFTYEAYEAVSNGIFTLNNIDLGTNKTINGATYDNGELTSTYYNADNKTITVAFKNGLTTVTNNAMEKTSGTLSITTGDSVSPTVTRTAALKSNKATLTIKDKDEKDVKIENARMYVVYGSVTGNATEYGIAVCESGDPATLGNDYVCYPATSVDKSGNFGVAIVDNETKDAFTAYVRPYYKTNNGTYMSNEGTALTVVTFEAVTE